MQKRNESDSFLTAERDETYPGYGKPPRLFYRLSAPVEREP